MSQWISEEGWDLHLHRRRNHHSLAIVACSASAHARAQDIFLGEHWKQPQLQNFLQLSSTQVPWYLAFIEESTVLGLVGLRNTLVIVPSDWKTQFPQVQCQNLFSPCICSIPYAPQCHLTTQGVRWDILLITGICGFVRLATEVDRRVIRTSSTRLFCLATLTPSHASPYKNTSSGSCVLIMPESISRPTSPRTNRFTAKVAKSRFFRVLAT